MYTGLLHTHVVLRYFIFIALVLVIGMALSGLTGKRPFGKWDNKAGLYLLIFTHMQALVGVILYFVSPWVKFGSQTMSDKMTRYWTVEHVFAMIIAVTLITVARVSSKKLPTDQARHKRLLILNGIALLVIVATIAMSDRRIL